MTAALAILLGFQISNAGPSADAVELSRMPAKVIEGVSPKSWSWDSKFLALTAPVARQGRAGIRRTLGLGEDLPFPYPRRLLRYSLDSDTLEEVTTLNEDFRIEDIAWVGPGADLLFVASAINKESSIVFFAPKGQPARVVAQSDSATLITFATSKQVSKALICLSGQKSDPKLLLITANATTEIPNVPANLRVCSVGNTDSDRFATFVGVEPPIGQGQTRLFGVDLAAGKLVPIESVPKETIARKPKLVEFTLRSAEAPNANFPGYDLLAKIPNKKLELLTRQVVDTVDSPDGQKTAARMLEYCQIFEYVRSKKRAGK
ncbi:hypothetical protein MCEMSE15_02669 [Fimbriimonadaceae bacterium]